MNYKRIETILIEDGEITITRGYYDVNTYHPSTTKIYKPTNSSEKRFYKAINKEINQQYSPSVNIQPRWIEIEW